MKNQTQTESLKNQVRLLKIDELFNQDELSNLRAQLVDNLNAQVNMSEFSDKYQTNILNENLDLKSKIKDCEIKSKSILKKIRIIESKISKKSEINKSIYNFIDELDIELSARETSKLKTKEKRQKSNKFRLEEFEY